MTNILHFVFNITGKTSSDFLQKLQMSGEVFSPPEPSRAKFTPSGRVFRLSRPLAWTLQKLQGIAGKVVFAPRAFQSEVYSIRASILPQSPPSLDTANEEEQIQNLCL